MALIALAFWATACPRPAETPSTATPNGEPADPVDPGDPGSLGSVLGDRHRVEDAAPPASPLRWKRPPPNCALTYELRTDSTLAHQPSDALPSSSMDSNRTVEYALKADDSGTVLSRLQDSDGVLGEGGEWVSTSDASLLESVLLSTDGLRWRAARDPSALWHLEFFTAPSPAPFFPELPEQSAVGSSALWSLGEPDDGTDVVRVEVQRWIRINGQLAAELFADFSSSRRDDVPGAPIPQVAQRAHMRARWVVLASGQLLWGSIRSASTMRMSIAGANDAQIISRTTHAEARLVSACGGLVLDRFPKSGAQRAAQAWLQAIDRFAAGDLAAASAWLQPSIRHEAPAVAALVRRYGPQVLGASPLRSTGPGPILRLVARGFLEGRSDQGVEVEVEVDVGGPKAQIRSLRIAATGAEATQLLFLAPFSHASVVDDWNPAPSGDSVLTVSTVLELDEDRWLLVRRGPERCALRLTRPPLNTTPGTAPYEWAIWPRPSAPPRKGHGTVVEPTGEPGPDRNRLRCGAVEIEWSAPRYVYLDPAFDVVPLATERLEEVDPWASRLWLSRRWGQLAYDAAAEARVTPAPR